jgi:hypothetical protein
LNVKALGIDPVKFTDNHFATRIQSLKPGEVAHFFVPIPRDLADVTIKVTDLVVEDPANANVLFGDNVLVHVVDAPTSMAMSRVDSTTFVSEDTTFVLDDPQPGLMRIAVAGSFSNGGTVSVGLSIDRRAEDRGRPTETGSIRQGEQIAVQVDVPAGTKELMFDLSWDSHWGRYPTADIDLVLGGPLGVVNSAGATLKSPERVTIANPTPGLWTAYISAITIHREFRDDDDDHPNDHDWRRHDHGSCAEAFRLRAFADGQRLQKLKTPKLKRR